MSYSFSIKSATYQPASAPTSFQAFTNGVSEFFSKNNATLKKIEALNVKIFEVRNCLHKGSLNEALPVLKDLLVQEAKWHIKPPSSNPKVQKAYKGFLGNLHSLQKHIPSRLITNWVAGEHDDKKSLEKNTIARWLLASPAQRNFAVYYNHSEVPLKFSEIPQGSVLLTDPYAYLAHKKLDGKRSFLRSLILIIKALACRLLTGMRYTHAEFCMGNGRAFDLDKKKGTWIRGEGMIKDQGDKVFYGVVLRPNQEKMLAAYNQRFPNARVANFEDLMQKINTEIEKAVKENAVQLNVGDIIKTVIPTKRDGNYDCTQTWRSGACRYSCSGTTSALFSRFGIDIGTQFNKVDKNITPRNFYQSHFFSPHYLIP